jgi:DNA-binding FadR family transcriptional regulator
MLEEAVDAAKFTVMSQRSPTRSEKVGQRLARRILRDITESSSVIGTKLPSEVQMSERYGVGRGSLREALRILEVQGLITIKPGPGGGPVVSGVSTEHLGATAALHLQFSGARLKSVADARLLLEPVLARQAAEKRDGAALGNIVDVIGEVDPDPAEVAANLRRARDFHAAVMDAAGNPVLALFGGALKDIWTSRVSGTLFPPDRQRDVWHAHREIGAAIVAGHPQKAEDLMRAHMEQFVQHARERYPGLIEERVAWR